MLWVIFGVCYYLGLNGIDDYTDITKAGISLPILLAGNYYLKIEPFFRITPIPAVVKHTIAPTTKAIILLFEI